MEEINNKREKLKQKIRNFNELMKEISEELTSIFMEGKEKEFQNTIIGMIRSLDNAQKTVKHAYNLFLNRRIDED